MAFEISFLFWKVDFNVLSEGVGLKGYLKRQKILRSFSPEIVLFFYYYESKQANLHLFNADLDSAFF